MLLSIYGEQDLKTEEGLQDREKEIEDLRKAIWYINDRIDQLKHH